MSCEELVLLGTTLSLEIAKACPDPDTLAVLAALFTTIGDQLALLALSCGETPLPAK